MKILKKVILFAGIACFFNAQALDCKIANPGKWDWIVSIQVNEIKREVTMIASEYYRGKVYTTQLVDVSGDRYTFNLSPQQSSGVTNLFVLFKAFDKWHLINAGVEEKNGTTVLKAVEPNIEYICSKK